MTPGEVVWFCNHKYGETAWMIEDKNWIYLYTLSSKWLIKKNDFHRFGKYTLFHSNHIEGEGYHIQKQGHDLDFLVYEAVSHDAVEKSRRLNFLDFKKSWEMYKYGQELFEQVQTFNFLCGSDLSAD